MMERGIQQWRPGDLPLSWIETCASAGWIYVAHHEQRMVGSVTIVWHDPLMWGEVSEPAGYVHMLMVDRSFAGYGIGRSLLAWAECFIKDAGRCLARLDCVRTNPQLRDYYERVGYVLVGHKSLPEVGWALEATLYEKSL
jgi:GNAT superfamily N-acetyltransferase